MSFLGIDIGSEYLKYSLLDKERDGLCLLRSGIIRVTDAPLSINDDERHEAVKIALNKVKEEIYGAHKSADLVLSISGFMSQVRVVELPGSKAKIAKQVLSYEVQQLLPHKTDIELLYSTTLLPMASGTRKGLVALSRADDITAYIDTLLDMNFQLKKIVLGPVSYKNIISRLDFSNSELSAIVDIGYKSTDIVLVHGSEIVDIRLIPMGCGQIVRKLGRKLGISLSEAHDLFYNWFKDNEPDSVIASKQKAPAKGVTFAEIFSEIEVPDFDNEVDADYPESEYIPFDNSDSEQVIPVEPEKTNHKADSGIKVIIEKGIRNIFAEVERSVSKAKRSGSDELSRPAAIYLTGSVTGFKAFAEIAEKCIIARKIEALDAQRLLSPGSSSCDNLHLVSCSLGLACCAAESQRNEINLIPETYIDKIRSPLAKILLAVAALFLATIPLPLVIHKARALFRTRQAVIDTIHKYESYRAAIGQEQELENSLDSLKNKLVPLERTAELQKGLLALIVKFNSLGKEKVWINTVRIFPGNNKPRSAQNFSRRRRTRARASGMTAKINPSLPKQDSAKSLRLFCEIKFESTSYRKIGDFIKELKRQRWAVNVSVKDAATFKLGASAASGDLTLGELDVLGKDRKKSVDAVISFEVI